MRAVRLAVVAAVLVQAASAFAAGIAAPGTARSSAEWSASPQAPAVPFTTHAEAMLTESGELVAQKYTSLRWFAGMGNELVITRRDISRVGSGQKLVALTFEAKPYPPNEPIVEVSPTFVDFDELAGLAKALDAMSAISAEASSPELKFSTRGGMVILASIVETTGRPAWHVWLQKSGGSFSFVKREDLQELSKLLTKVVASG